MLVYLHIKANLVISFKHSFIGFVTREGHWWCVTREGNQETQTNTQITAVGKEYLDLDFVVSPEEAKGEEKSPSASEVKDIAQNSQVAFYVNDEAVAVHTTNIPSDWLGVIIGSPSQPAPLSFEWSRLTIEM